MHISMNNILETICNPLGRFKTLTGIMPRYRDNDRNAFLYSRGLSCFTVIWNGRDYILKAVSDHSRFPEVQLRQIDANLKTVRNPYFADFRYYGQEMLVYGDLGEGVYCDIILTEEIKGIPLDIFVREKCDGRQFASLEKLYGNYCSMAAYVLRSGMVHGKVKPENISVAHDLSCKLINYENMSFPGMDTYPAVENHDNAAFAIIVL